MEAAVTRGGVDDAHGVQALSQPMRAPRLFLLFLSDYSNNVFNVLPSSSALAWGLLWLGRVVIMSSQASRIWPSQPWWAACRTWSLTRSPTLRLFSTGLRTSASVRPECFLIASPVDVCLLWRMSSGPLMRTLRPSPAFCMSRFNWHAELFRQHNPVVGLEIR